jgi:DNA-binding CsgD family transcriptional regulator
MTCSFFVGALVVLLFPVIVLLWLTESKQQRAKRWRKSGQTYASIASRLNVSPTTARRYCLA